MLIMELIKGTRVYEELREEAEQEAREKVKQEAKIEIIAKLLQRGMNVEELAEILELDVEVVRKVAEEQ